MPSDCFATANPRTRPKREFNNQPSNAMKKCTFPLFRRTQTELGARGYLLTLQKEFYYCAPRVFVIGKKMEYKISEWKVQMQTIFHLNDYFAALSYWTMYFLVVAFARKSYLLSCLLFCVFLSLAPSISISREKCKWRKWRNKARSEGR